MIQESDPSLFDNWAVIDADCLTVFDDVDAF